MNVLIRCDSSNIIGTGHVMRMLNLCEYYPEYKFTFLCRDFKMNITNKIIEKNYGLIKLDYNVEPELNNYRTWIGKEYDDEGRVITCEFSKFYIVHVYTPNSGQVLNRLDFRTNEWDPAFTKYLNKLQETKNVILCGDLNVAHNEIDLKNPKSNLRTAGYTIEERTSFELLLEKTKMKDSFRLLNPNDIKYSYWSYRFKCREKDIGWRIDYFLVSNKLIKKIIKSNILSEIYGSDHAPIILIINIK